jgi:hypothetical protein
MASMEDDEPEEEEWEQRYWDAWGMTDREQEVFGRWVLGITLLIVTITLVIFAVQHW